MAAYPSQTPQGDWKVHMYSDQYAAWESWLRSAFRKRYFTKPIMVVPFEWPPDSEHHAQLAAAWLHTVRSAVNKDRDWHYKLQMPTAYPSPWHGEIVTHQVEPEPAELPLEPL
jgi:hypothetical protein